MTGSDLISLLFSAYGAFIATLAYLSPRTAPAPPPPPAPLVLVVMVVVSAPSSSASCTDSSRYVDTSARAGSVRNRRHTGYGY